jgi:hypothetical protein
MGPIGLEHPCLILALFPLPMFLPSPLLPLHPFGAIHGGFVIASRQSLLPFWLASASLSLSLPPPARLTLASSSRLSTSLLPSRSRPHPRARCGSVTSSTPVGVVIYTTESYTAIIRGGTHLPLLHLSARIARRRHRPVAHIHAKILSRHLSARRLYGFNRIYIISIITTFWASRRHTLLSI